MSAIHHLGQLTNSIHSKIHAQGMATQQSAQYHCHLLACCVFHAEKLISVDVNGFDAFNHQARATSRMQLGLNV